MYLLAPELAVDVVDSAQPGSEFMPALAPNDRVSCTRTILPTSLSILPAVIGLVSLELRGGEQAGGWAA